MLRHLVILGTLALAISVANSAYAPPVPLAVPPVDTPVPFRPVPPQIVTPEPVVQPQTREVPTDPQPVEYLDYQDEDDADSPGFVVQNGIEGFIVPASLLETTKIEPALSFVQRLGLLFGLTKLPKFAIALFPKFAFLFKHLALLLLLGGALTTAVCTFTPFCGIALGVRSENEIFSLKEKAWDAANFVINSIEKYREIARQEAQKKNEISKKRRR